MVLIPNVQLADKGLYVDVFVDTLEVLIVGRVVLLTLVQRMTFVDKMLSVETKVDVPYVNVYLVIRATHIRDV